MTLSQSRHCLFVLVGNAVYNHDLQIFCLHDQHILTIVRHKLAPVQQTRVVIPSQIYRDLDSPCRRANASISFFHTTPFAGSDHGPVEPSDPGRFHLPFPMFLSLFFLYYSLWERDTDVVMYNPRPGPSRRSSGESPLIKYGGPLVIQVPFTNAQYCGMACIFGISSLYHQVSLMS